MEEDPKICKPCIKTSKRGSNLRRHEENIHGPNPKRKAEAEDLADPKKTKLSHQCEQCSKSF
jgi:uncharacterized Zn-finger protein